MSRLAVAVLVLVAGEVMPACGGAQRPDARPGDEYLAALKVDGNAALETSDLLRGLALERALDGGLPVDPFVLANDLTRIRGAYVRIGFFAVTVTPRLTHTGGATTVTFVVVEGPRAKTRVELIGLPTDDPQVAIAKLRKLVPLADGAPFDYEVYDDAKQTLLAAIEDAGYAHAQLGATVIADRVNADAVARFIFDPGPRCVFGKVTIIGADGDLEDAVRARLAFKAGAVYSATAVAKTQRALYELGRFSTVRVEPDHDLAATKIAIKISVSVGTRHEQKVGGGVGYEPLTYDVRARYGYSVAGCIDALTACSVELQPALTLSHDLTNLEPKIRALASLQRLDFLRTFLTGTAELGYDYLTVEAYTYTGPHARLGLRAPLGAPWALLRVGWLFAYYAFVNIDPVVNDADRARLGLDLERLGAYEQALVLDLRDSPITPHKGLYFEARVSEGTPYAGGQFEYLEVVPELRGYAPLGTYVIAARARAGQIFGHVPATERFFSGGAVAQRGFDERRLAPTITGDVKDSDGSEHFHSVPVGGSVIVETGVELRTPPIGIFGLDVGFVAFLDYADVADSRASIDLGHLHAATGGGLRIQTPLGAIRFDIGYRLNRTGRSEPEPTGRLQPLAIHFGIGEAY